MFIKLEEYLQKPLEERQAHLDLESECIEIGGDSRVFRGLLAHHMKTTMDFRNGYVCHKCNNPKCSNVNHLYWGTPHENHLDQIENGTFKTIHERSIEKYGKDEFKKILKKAGAKGGKTGGGHNKLSSEIISSRISDVQTITGWGSISKLSAKWNVSHTQVRKFINKYC